MTKSVAIDILIDYDKKSKQLAKEVRDIMDKMDSEYNLGILTEERIFELDEKVLQIRRKANALLILQAEAEIELGFNQIAFKGN